MKPVSLLLLILLAGCATQPHRARQLSNDFQKLPPDVQARVLRGEIQRGDTPHAVYFALGAPNSIEIIDIAGSPYPQWEYVGIRKTITLPSGETAEHFEPATDMIFPSPFSKEVHVRLLVDFEDDRVSRISFSDKPKRRRDEALPLQAFLPDSPR